MQTAAEKMTLDRLIEEGAFRTIANASWRSSKCFLDCGYVGWPEQMDAVYQFFRDHPFVNFPYSQEFVGTWRIKTMMCDISLWFPLDVSAGYLDSLKARSVCDAYCLWPDDLADE